MWKINYSEEFLKQIKKIDSNKQKIIISKIEELSNLERPFPQPAVRRLVGKLKGFFRLRVGALRIIFKVSLKGKEINIYTVLHRRNAYK